MFPMGGWSWGLDSDWGWGWGWVAAVGGIIVLGIFLIPWFFFLLNLQNTLNRVSDSNRAMPAGHVWLNFIPIFNLGWFIYTVTRVRDSVKAEYRSRNWKVEGDFGYNVGLATGVLAIVSFFMGWVPVLGWAVGLAQLVCWIIYWLKTHELKNSLGERAGLAGPTPYAPPPPYAAPPPYPGFPVPPSGAAPGAGQQIAPAAAPAVAAPAVAATAVAATALAASEAAQESAGATGPAMCAGCGSTYDPGDKFCRTCGLPLPQGRPEDAGA